MLLILRMNFVGHKRFKKQAKFIANFVLYTIHKRLELNDEMDKILMMSKEHEELKKRKAQVSESISNKIIHKAKQLSMIEKVIIKLYVLN